jgi:alginate O-acetyltransferase complex protein AlgI
MAIGILKILGFTIPENFNNPYISKSITEFWKRWHISLTTWMREYLYIPLGGNRRGTLRTYLNQWLVFFLSGLWHGASWNFVAWGILHGTFMCFEKMFLLKKLDKIPAIFRSIGTLFIVIIGWVIFRSNTLQESWIFIKQMFSFSTINLHPDVNRFMYIDNRGIFIFFLACIISLLPAFGVYQKIKDFVISHNTAKLFFCSFVLLLSALKIGTGAISPFIYFRF